MNRSGWLSGGRKYGPDRPAQAAYFIMPTLPQTLFNKEFSAGKPVISRASEVILIKLAA